MAAIELGGERVTDGADRHAQFRSFFAEQYPSLAGYCTSLVGTGCAEELAQEAMTAVFARWPLLREPRAYAFRVATNLARAKWRREQREQDSWRLERQLAAPSQPPDVGLWDAVHRLPARLRDVVLLHYVADLPVSDVARVLRRPVGTVKRRLHEARAALADRLEDSRD